MEKCNKVCISIISSYRLVKDEDGKVVDATTFKQMVGSLMHLLATRPNMTFFVCSVARYMERPTKLHVVIDKRIMRYLHNTLDLGILFKCEGKNNLHLLGWTNFDFAEDRDEIKAPQGMCSR